MQLSKIIFVIDPFRLNCECSHQELSVEIVLIVVVAYPQFPPAAGQTAAGATPEKSDTHRTVHVRVHGGEGGVTGLGARLRVFL